MAKSVYACHPCPITLIFLSAHIEPLKQVDKLLPLETQVELLRGRSKH